MREINEEQPNPSSLSEIDPVKRGKPIYRIAGVEVSVAEASFVENTQGNFNKLRVIFGKRFLAWCAYNKINPTGILKVKLKQAFIAGCFSTLDSSVRKALENEQL